MGKITGVRSFKKEVKRKRKLAKKMKEFRHTHLPYEVQWADQVLTITLMRHVENPKLVCEHGEINYQRELINKQWSFTFKYEDLPEIDGIMTKLLVIDGQDEYFLSTYVNDREYNYNHIEAIHYTDEYIFYLRNTASYAGRLVVQKKIRAFFENQEFETKVAEAVQLYADSKPEYIVLYEKYGAKFEESASRVFERIAEFDNVYYVLSSYSPQYPALKAKYGKKIVSQEEDMFLELIFRARYYIGTEVPIHLTTLRTPYPELRKEIMDTEKHRFIFLQHGVMYALSLDTPSRNSFKKKGLHAPYKVIVSSELEAEHLIELGSYQRSDLWKTGLATFDGKKINDQASKITVMLTWRPWDEQKTHFEDTSYYQALSRIIDQIPDKRNLQIVLHPKVVELISSDNPLLPYVYQGLINDALNDTKVLISDYSSVTFDAFYRGTNVIFWWVELEECLEKYDNHLMLSDENVFGDVIYDNENLLEAIRINYYSPQSELYQSRYQKIVEFHDDCNTSRIVENLIKEGMFDRVQNWVTLGEMKKLLKKFDLSDQTLKLLDNSYEFKLSKAEYREITTSTENYLVISLITKLHFADDVDTKKLVLKEMYDVISNYSSPQ